MRFKFKSILVLISLLPFMGNATSLEVNLPNSSLKLSYEQPVRLSQVLTDSNLVVLKQGKVTPYWLGAQLFEPSQNEEIKRLKTIVLEKLEYLAKYYPESTFKADLLTSLLKKANFGYRHFISLDNDLVRLEPELDPILSGKYRLVIPNRENDVLLVGTIQPLASEPLNPELKPADYFIDHSLPKNSDTEQLFVIQPDGSITSYAQEYWRPGSIYLAPGSILYTGFKSLPSEHANLNQQVAKLLSYMEYPEKGSFQ
ncbi:capsule biosynthesis GfcC family protein [Vibrio hannami]|uniref:capsule biosynthesis GfcC D2 domain-containing protein n=1 Tax=Vibrio hannami TaxID=2717094 RepID=UPI00240F875C|nr:capsule biosynthesis GfcC D2 domain-containing protein [Vibrio hannami]MDG3088670.1 capsule biosynthesis GfcC family protein [Vibrio hannami]